MAKMTASASKMNRKCRNASAFDILRLVEADFGKPHVQAVLADATKSLEKAKKIASAFIADLQAMADAGPNERYYVPAFAMKNGSFFFGDMIDGDIKPFLSLKPEDAAHVFPMMPLTGITAGEAANIFLHDEEKVLVPLTALAATLFEQSKKGKTDAVVADLQYFLAHLVLHLELGVNVNGYVDLPREAKV
ncbi:hypothetical protein [Rhizobium sp. IMFF44]|uniref:hypothetical protein n=1 Tax=Rhizobium sp. IMFF44 TaxID=3342350 RepID=UPI0035BA0415